MPGKRSRQLLRTVSLSQLGENGNDRNPALRDTKMMMELASAASAPESSSRDGILESIGPSFHGDVSLESKGACSYRDADFASMYENTEEICFGEFEAPSQLGDILLKESNPYMNSEPLDNNIGDEGLIFASVSTPATSLSLGKPLQQAASHQENHHVPWQYQVSSILLEAAHGSALPTRHFLDACSLCSKRIGHGEDVFIYRGDRAFCSDECRHVQIVADERREKCGLAF